MTRKQKRTIKRNLDGILRFYDHGCNGVPNPPKPGGFVKCYQKSFPNLYEKNKEVIWLIDGMIIAAFNAGMYSPIE